MANIIEMPKLSDTMTTGTVVNWLKKEGDVVKSGDILAEIETDKATQELETFDEGTILKIYVKAGGKTPCGQPLCAIGEAGEEAPEVKAPADAPESPGKPTEPPQDGSDATEGIQKDAPEEAQKPQPESPTEPKTDPIPTPPVEISTSTSRRVSVSPLARKVAEEKGIPLNTIQGSGPGGRIVKTDVLAAADSGVKGIPAAAIPLEEKLTPVSSIREVIARRLLESKTQVPHFYLEKEVDAGPLLKTRVALNDRFKNLGQAINLTLNDYILKASVEALRVVPAMNASWEGENIHQHGAVHLSFGVALKDGLVTPVIHDAEKKDLVTISREARELIDKARSKKLSPEEMSGSTFTVTNLGMFGINSFYGIINPPNAGILSVGGTFKKPIVDDNDNIVVGHRMSVGISGDHRVVDGAVGALFLKALADNLENPALMLV